MRPNHSARALALLELDDDKVALDLVVEDGQRVIIAMDDALATSFVLKAAALLLRRRREGTITESRARLAR
jgi:hypothetical protein